MHAARHLMVLTTVLAILAPSAHADGVYRWRDARGQWHFSNVEKGRPATAEALELAPVAIAAPDGAAAFAPPAAAPVAAVRTARDPIGTTCGPVDTRGLRRAVVPVVAATKRPEFLTLFVAGHPVWVPEDSVVLEVEGSDVLPASPLSQGAIAYPGGSPCPDQPPLERYPVRDAASVDGDELCADFRRALAQVGVAGNRNQNVARSFRGIARRFVEVAANDYVASDAYQSVSLPRWVVEAHIAQTASLAGETEDFVDELEVALEEIDAAARARGCW